MSSILVTGGAGYIGSFMVKRLVADNHTVTVLDSLERGNGERIDREATSITGSILDKELLSEVFKKGNFDSVIHFAGYISVNESTKAPGLYFEDNVQGTVNILDAMAASSTRSIVFSSSAAVYGNPQIVPIPEDHPKNPESPYGESKLMVETILSWYQRTKKIRSVSLRYFNASGAALDGSLGEAHMPETHIIPCAIEALLHNEKFTLYGNDYNTVDGTCVRDYIHVLDLVDAHVKSLEKLQKDDGNFSYNVGTGVGYSNQQIISMIEEVSGQKMETEIAERRSGDPATLVADPSKIQMELAFSPQYSHLKTIISSAWKWHNQAKK